jgi:hypothetical protein
VISLPNDISVEDVGQWLGGGWFLAQRDAESAPEPATFCHFDGNMGWRALDGHETILVRELTFPHWPTCGAVNLNGYAIVLERMQVRQWRRTYNDRCITLHIPRKWDVMKRFGTSIGMLTPNHEDALRAAFSPIYYTFSQAVDKIEQERWISVALNAHLIIAGGDNAYLVYYRNKLIGNIKDGRITPLGTQDGRIRRIIKFFEGRVTL